MRQNNIHIPTIAYFVLAAALIAYFFPREGKFRYLFYEGKPWQYELLTASSDFPVYKTDEEVKAEKDSILRKFDPYYRLNANIQTEQIEKLRSTYNQQTKDNPTSSDYIRYIESSLVKLYQNGIISSEDIAQLKKEGHSQINILENTLAQPHPIDDLFTVRSAYESIINNCPEELQKSVLQSYDINNYLVENLAYANDISEKVKTNMLQNIALSNGMVQAGERIVDRGEIIDTHTYNVLRSLKTLYEAKTIDGQAQSIILAGQFILVLGLISCLWLYLWSFRPKIFHNRKTMLFMAFCVFAFCILTELCITYDLVNIYVLPYAIVPIAIRTFFDSRTALFTHLIIILICSLMVPFPHEFLLLEIVAGMVVTFSLKDLSERSQLIRSSFFIFLSYVICYAGFTLYQEASLDKISGKIILYFGINFILLMFAYVLVYMMEKVFGYVSNITLVELSNFNNPLLKKLSETCPGTFQHSMQVSILATEAAARIGANAQLVRTGALYHDIGKMNNPLFFTENQKNVNPHDGLSYEQSAQIIINHVIDGEKMAEKAALPSAVINFIRTHHGKGKAKYFYNSFKNTFPDKSIDEKLFTYPGPNPSSKETAILMMADSVEAAAHSLKEHNEENVYKLVNKIIDGQIADGLLQDAPLTFKDVETIKDVFVEKLKTMFHARISYPDLKKYESPTQDPHHNEPVSA